MYQRRAEIRKLRFELTLDQFQDIIQQPCVFCGEPYDPRGVDRKDNRKGYLPDNCQSCCGRCNNFKGARDQETWLAGILEIVKYQEKLKQQKPKQAPQSIPEPTEPTVLTAQPRFSLRDQNIPVEAQRFLDHGF